MIKLNKLFSGASEERVNTLADLIRRTNEQRGVADAVRTEEILRDAWGTPISAFAKRVVELGRIRRGEITDPRTRPPKGSFAEKVINAGRKARNEDPI